MFMVVIHIVVSNDWLKAVEKKKKVETQIQQNWC